MSVMHIGPEQEESEGENLLSCHPDNGKEAYPCTENARVILVKIIEN